MKEWNWLSEELDRLREQELYRTMTVLEGPQTTVVEAEGRPQRLFPPIIIWTWPTIRR